MRMKLSELVEVLTKAQEVHGGDLDTNCETVEVRAVIDINYGGYHQYEYRKQAKRETTRSVRLACPEDARPECGPIATT